MRLPSRLLRAGALCALALGLSAPVLASVPVFINELHYRNTGADVGEGVEIAGPAGTDLTGWSAVYYRGSTGAAYLSQALSGVIDDEENGCGALGFLGLLPNNSIRNGTDGVALIDPDGVVQQFLSYGNGAEFTAVNGGAVGAMTTNIGVTEPSGTPVGESLQLTGTGFDSADFTWTGPTTASPGSKNAGQTFDACPPQLVAEKTDALEDDVYGDGFFSPGDTIRYTITIENVAGDRAGNVQFMDAPDGKTSLVVGSVTTSKGNVVTGNTAGDTTVHVDANGINLGVTVTITFDVIINDPLSDAEIAEGVENQGEVTANNLSGTVLTNDPDYVPNVCDLLEGAAPTYTPLNDICDGVVVTETCRVNGSPVGRPCQGTNGRDVIFGSEGRDVIKAGGDDDAVYGLEGRDLICGDDGDDYLQGDDGNDRMDGGEGDDILRGVAGRDVLSGGPGDDDLRGDDGRDTLEGGPGIDDVLDGGRGSDLCADEDLATFIRCGRSCGLGFELVGLLPALLWARRRFSARA